MSIEVSLTGAFRNYGDHYGFGRACDEIVNGFKRLDLNFGIDVDASDIELYFGHPPFEFRKYSNYKIGYIAWESTGYRPEWVNVDDADELWAPTTLLANQLEKDFGVPSFVFPHGIGKQWKPKRHYAGSKHKDILKPFVFLHIGEPQYRKNAQMVVDAFAELFGNNPNYMLILKTSGINTTAVLDENKGVWVSPDNLYSNVIIMDGIMSNEHMISLYQQANCFVYPSIGEGFGLQPLEAMASGCPTICTSNWAEYEKFINVPIEGVLGVSPWQDLHPGETFNVTLSQVKIAMSEMVENYDKYSKEAFKNSFLVHQEYDWDVQNLKAIKRFEEIKNSRI